MTILLLAAPGICIAAAEASDSSDPMDIPAMTPSTLPTLGRISASAAGFAPPGWKVSGLNV
ncbi:hypothetical protein HMP09_0609 [Sphingomonas sp. HMP9]|uniref:hypothetical protein n=1 Tax=Sphingomonas sp. HMP9 TaxID=1517554 RepID=UPI0015967FC1|nr:hypothetical protein [Sphingomonas sp. HMP9]BCA61375.1 hypothetical protein HMP09_0609 [Sphingomonas sp. HMP9]